MTDLSALTDRELDALVAEHAFGYQWWYGFNCWSGNPLVIGRDGHLDTKIEFLDLLELGTNWTKYERRLPTEWELANLKRRPFSGPCYSTDPVASDALLERMRELGWNLDLIFTDIVSAQFWGMERMDRVFDISKHRAIVLAALRALQVGQ